jgi:hypothetical protein
VAVFRAEVFLETVTCVQISFLTGQFLYTTWEDSSLRNWKCFMFGVLEAYLTLMISVYEGEENWLVKQVLGQN